MKYEVKMFGSKNCHERVFENGARVFFSYATPVCALIPGRGALRTTEKYSVTTSKHCTMWAREFMSCEPATPEELVRLFEMHRDAPMWA